MQTEDDIQRLHNRLEYLRGLTTEQRDSMEYQIAVLTDELNDLQMQLKND